MDALADFLLLVDDRHPAIGRDADEGAKGARLGITAAAAQDRATQFHRMGDAIADDECAAEQAPAKNHLAAREAQAAPWRLRLAHARLLS
ncbi:hypothetical protein [Novosphingobium kaempferiae]|uniref:hypothetical protein n=1 Tax=Novosphingobium kaempferiae TaxID=2896849 RepID=UPI001E5CFC44|nr:hypothetical protein [Novosphingobium kaempferiae]